MSRFRRRLMTLEQQRKAFADDYIPCEYIENVSTAYINTGVNVKTSKYFDIDISVTTLDRNNYIIGQRAKNNVIDSSSNVMTGILVNTSNNFETGVARTDVKYTNYTVEINKRYRLTGDYKNVTVKYNGIDEETQETVEQSFKITNAGVYTTNFNRILFLFNINQPTLNESNAFRGRMYGCKIYNDNGTVLLRDYIPMYKISTDEYGMFDQLNQKFYGSGNSSKFTGSLLFIDDYLKGMCQARWADSEGRILYTTLANSVFGEEKTKIVSKLKWVNLTSTFNTSVKLYGIKSTSTQRQADCTVNFNYNGTTNWLGLYIFYKRWGYANGGSSYNGISSTWTSYGGYYYTIYLDSYSSGRNVKYMTYKNVTGYRPAQYTASMVQVLVNSDDI